METKSSIRRNVKALVSEIKNPKTQAAKLCKKLIEVSKEVKYNNILVFMPLSDEVNIIGFIEYLLEHHKKVFVPVSFENGLMEFYELNSLKNMSTGKFGILEPDNRLVYHYDKRDMIIVPGVAFDHKLNRLGRGKGYYDIFLNKYPMTKIGVCYNEQILPQIPSETHDVKMNMVISEKYSFNSLD